MAWNEPGGDKRDPWGGGGGSGGNDQGPPDLDEVVRKLQNKMGGLFGGKGGGGPSASGPGGGGVNKTLVGVVLAIGLVIWGATGFYIIDEGNRGVVLRFGAWSDTTMPGPHWHLPYPVEQVLKVNVEEQRFVEVGYRSNGAARQAAGSVPREALMLTGDENIVDLQLAVQYVVKDPGNYLFNVRNPDQTLKQATESAIREVVGKNNMDFVIQEGQTEVAARAKQILQQTLDSYNTGLQVLSVNLQRSQPPQEVKAAFDDAIKAREDKERFESEAVAYARGVIPKARGAGARQLEEANAYREQVISQAKGEASRFSQLLTEYRLAPEVTRERLYLETIESVLANTNKVMIDAEGGNNMLYLPLDQLMRRNQSSDAGVRNQAPSTSSMGTDTAPVRSSSDIRESARARRPR